LREGEAGVKASDYAGGTGFLDAPCYISDGSPVGPLHTALRCYPVSGTDLGIAPGRAHQFDAYWSIAGLVAGALGATAYAFNCADDSLPFIAIWYRGSIALCTFIGSKLGPKLLRW
jgi:hypothetical protein